MSSLRITKRCPYVNDNTPVHNVLGVVLLTSKTSWRGLKTVKHLDTSKITHVGVSVDLYEAEMVKIKKKSLSKL